MCVRVWEEGGYCGLMLANGLKSPFFPLTVSS